MRLTSSAFEPDGVIPERYTCDGLDISPPLTIHDVPAGTASLVLTMDDPDCPGRTWDHWVAYDVPVLTEIPEGVPTLGTPGSNTWGRTGYGGPCPPRGTHRYVFTIYALDRSLGLGPRAEKASVLKAVGAHVLAEASLTGRYSRS